MEISSQPQTTSSTPGGATITTAYVGREVKVFGVFETEIDTLSSLNAQSTLFYALSSALASFAVGIWTNAVFYERLTPAGQFATGVGAPILMLIGVVLFIVATNAWWKRKSTIASIKSQSREAPK